MENNRELDTFVSESFVNKDSETPTMDATTYHSLLDAFIPSVEMRDYLKSQPVLHESTLLDIIIGSPVPLSEKAKWGWGDFKKAAEEALMELTLQPGEMFTLSDAWYDEDIHEANSYFNAPFLSFENVAEHIREEISEYKEETDDWFYHQWYVLEKWIPADNNKLSLKYTYYILRDQVMYFRKNEDRHFAMWVDPNVPVPFHVGDLLTVDCRPFAPLKHALLLERGDNHDCCCLQALCLDEKTGLWTTGAVKHWSLFGFGIDPLYTPIYNLARFVGKLPQEEEPLLVVQKIMGTEEKNGRKLWDCINGYKQPETKHCADGLTTEQLLGVANKCFGNKNSNMD